MRADEPNDTASGSSGGEGTPPPDSPEKAEKREETATSEGPPSEVAAAGAKAAETGEKPKQRRGFAAMDRAKVRAIAMLGGAAVHRKGTAHRFSREEAREAGRKGGLAPHRVRGRKLPPEATEEKGTPKEG